MKYDIIKMYRYTRKEGKYMLNYIDLQTWPIDSLLTTVHLIFSKASTGKWLFDRCVAKKPKIKEDEIDVEITGENIKSIYVNQSCNPNQNGEISSIVYYKSYVHYPELNFVIEKDGDEYNVTTKIPWGFFIELDKAFGFVNKFEKLELNINKNQLSELLFTIYKKTLVPLHKNMDYVKEFIEVNDKKDEVKYDKDNLYIHNNNFYVYVGNYYQPVITSIKSNNNCKELVFKNKFNQVDVFVGVLSGNSSFKDLIILKKNEQSSFSKSISKKDFEKWRLDTKSKFSSDEYNFDYISFDEIYNNIINDIDNIILKFNSNTNKNSVIDLLYYFEDRDDFIKLLQNNSPLTYKEGDDDENKTIKKLISCFQQLLKNCICKNQNEIKSFQDILKKCDIDVNDFIYDINQLKKGTNYICKHYERYGNDLLNLKSNTYAGLFIENIYTPSYNCEYIRENGILNIQGFDEVEYKPLFAIGRGGTLCNYFTDNDYNYVINKFQNPKVWDYEHLRVTYPTYLYSYNIYDYQKPFYALKSEEEIDLTEEQISNLKQYYYDKNMSKVKYFVNEVIGTYLESEPKNEDKKYTINMTENINTRYIKGLISALKGLGHEEDKYVYPMLDTFSDMKNLIEFLNRIN